MATRAQRNRFAVQPLPELPKRRDAKRDNMVDAMLAAIGLVVGVLYYIFG